jgi:hypothetical protein
MATPGPEWVLYEELPEDSEVVSFNRAGTESDSLFEICQTEMGVFGGVHEEDGRVVCRIPRYDQISADISIVYRHVEHRFFVLQLAEGADDGEVAGCFRWQ